jgi:hypothetical protein
MLKHIQLTQTKMKTQVLCHLLTMEKKDHLDAIDAKHMSTRICNLMKYQLITSQL